MACGLLFFVFIRDPSLESMAKKVDKNLERSGMSSRASLRDSSGIARQPTFKELTLIDKVSDLTTLMRSHLKKKPILYVVITGAAITRLLAVLFSTYLLLWISMFHGGEDLTEEQQVAARKQSQDIYIRIMVASALICVVVLPVFGKVCDVFDPRKIMPFAFLTRCATTYLFWLLESPDSWQCFAVCVSMVVATVGEQITCDAIFMKNLNKETRGILNGAYSFAGQLGILVFSIVAGWMFDKMGHKSPFIATGLLDFGFTILFVAFLLG